MKAFSFSASICILLLLATSPLFSQGYEISVSMKTKNDTVVLGYIFANENKMYADTTIVMKNGKGVFKSKKTLPKGLYFIYNDRKKFDILIGGNQKFGVVADTTDFIKGNRYTSSPDNDVYQEFWRYEISARTKMQQLEEQYKNSADDAEKKAISEQGQALGRERMEFIKKIVGDNEGLYVSKYLKAMFVPVEMPDLPREEQYYWYRTHYFDILNIYDPDLLRTPLYEKKITDYLTWFSGGHPVDSTCVEMDRMLTKAQTNKEVFRCMLATMYNHFINSNLIIRENFWVHLVDRWYVPHADWGVNIEEMKKAADKVRNTLIGKIAPPLEQLLVLPAGHFKAAALDTSIKNDIHAGTIIPDFRKSIQSKYIAIMFWDINCSHCKKTMEEMWEIYEANKNKGLQVIALQIHWEGKAKWIDFINEHGMYDWINAWIIYDNKWHDLYEASVVPIIYLLNDKKEIMYKRIQPDQLKSFMEFQK